MTEKAAEHYFKDHRHMKLEHTAQEFDCESSDEWLSSSTITPQYKADQHDKNSKAKAMADAVANGTSGLKVEHMPAVGPFKFSRLYDPYKFPTHISAVDCQPVMFAYEGAIVFAPGTQLEIVSVDSNVVTIKQVDPVPSKGVI